MPAVKPYAGTQAVRRALALLKAFSDGRPEWVLPDLAAATGLNKTTAYRLLTALEAEGLVTRSFATDGYRLGPEAIALGTRALRSNDLRGAAHDELVRLAREVGETASLEVLVGDEVLILDEVQGRNLLGATLEVGTRWPAHATSTGKVLLSAARDEPTGSTAAENSPKRVRLTRITPRTITSAARLETELAKVRERGYATAVEELVAGYVAVGAPVRDHHGGTVAAVSIGGPSVRLTKDRISELARQVRAAADRISRRLGAPPVPESSDDLSC